MPDPIIWLIMREMTCKTPISRLGTFVSSVQAESTLPDLALYASKPSVLDPDAVCSRPKSVFTELSAAMMLFQTDLKASGCGLCVKNGQDRVEDG